MQSKADAFAAAHGASAKDAEAGALKRHGCSMPALAAGSPA
jgi:hypothetical protein